MRENKNYNRIVVGLLLIVLVLSLSGCDLKADATKSKNNVYTSAQEEFEFIIDAISKKDKEAIKDKFSEYAINNIDHIDEKLQRLMDEFPGYEGSVEISDTFYRHSNASKLTYIYTPSYDFVVDGDKYRMRIIYYVEAEDDPSKLGWYSIQILKRGDPSYSSNLYTHDVKDDPDILLWDYTKDE